MQQKSLSNQHQQAHLIIANTNKPHREQLHVGPTSSKEQRPALPY
jgi:hypothetical protein